MNIHDLMAADNEEENTINEIINKSEKENIISKIFSDNEKENSISEITSNNESVVNENDEYKRQIKKSRPCHLVWNYFTWNKDYTSVMLANTTYTTINAFGLGNKVIAVTTDNVSNMNVFEDELAKLLLENYENTLFCHVRYAAHILNLVAKDVQATSVASEQMFSVAKFTISPTRCRLDPEKARAALCLKTWYAADLIKNIKNN
ncbi:12852_t:CDS:2 [Cetraspora pellucida]|uniref:12852_t:CDS:1 n=1 Tax=Cetraspora pellucida TaxID=1433469 RepID=A0ACA9LI48_9GLOM|nr:12852_t:CDS:2 [Cetraspora pellucida]